MYVHAVDQKQVFEKLTSSEFFFLCLFLSELDTPELVINGKNVNYLSVYLCIHKDTFTYTC